MTELYGTTGRFGDVAVNVRFTRIIFKCKACKHVWAREYRKVYSVLPETIWPANSSLKPYRVPAKFQLVRFENGQEIHDTRDYTCAECGKQGEATVVIGKLSEEHKCDARCRSAKNGACECSCNGANHGINHL